jgi:hypothetical protein
MVASMDRKSLYKEFYARKPLKFEAPALGRHLVSKQPTSDSTQSGNFSNKDNDDILECVNTHFRGFCCMSCGSEFFYAKPSEKPTLKLSFHTDFFTVTVFEYREWLSCKHKEIVLNHELKLDQQIKAFADGLRCKGLHLFGDIRLFVAKDCDENVEEKVPAIGA